MGIRSSKDGGFVPTRYGLLGPRTEPRVDYERIFVLDDRWEFLGEYVLKDDCPLDFTDLQGSMPLNGLRHLVAFYRGEYAFTPFRVDDLWFVVLTRGVPRIEDRGSIGTLLAAARVHIVPNLAPALARREAMVRDRERELEDREAVLFRREQRVQHLEADLHGRAARLGEREAEVQVREGKLLALRDYAIRMQRSFIKSARGGDPGPGKAGGPSEARTGRTDRRAP